MSHGDIQPDGLRSYGPGKFSLIVDEYVYRVSLDGCDDEIGSVTENGRWYGMIKSAIVDGTNAEFRELLPAEQELLYSTIGLILTEDSQGFVNVDYYDDAGELERDWAEIVNEVSAWFEEE